MVAPTVVDYQIDRDDHLVWVGPQWAPFALANDAPELATPAEPAKIWTHP